jgi:hypothetical protein
VTRLAIALAAPALVAASGQIDSIRPLIDAYCAKCHGPEQRIAGLDLTQFRTDDQVLKHRRLFTRAVELVRSREMPPVQPQPTEQERARLADGIHRALTSVDWSKHRNPGAVTMPRLNRAEYDNTIRDLTGLDLRPSSTFPVDPPGESGFDNDREGLFLPPLLLEKYLAAANLVVDEMIAANRPRPPFARTIEVETMRNTETQTRAKAYGYDIQVVQNTIYDYVTFPTSGTYEFKVTAWGSHDGQGRLPGVALRVANELRGQSVVTADQAHPGTYAFTTFVRRGSHRVSLHFFGQPTAAPEFNKGKKAEGPGRAVLSLDRIDIADAPGARDRESAAFLNSRRAVADFAARAWRRPLDKAELTDLDRQPSLASALKFVLVSPNFLFRVEGSAKPGAEYRLNDYELASRLSYFLWMSMPDPPLFDLARQHRLRDPKVLAGQVRRMLADSKSSAFLDAFFPQWLGYSELGKSVGPDRKAFPAWTDGLREAMLAEASLFFERMVRDDEPLTGILDARLTYLNEELARHYGIQGIVGRQMRRVELADPNRGGVLGMAAVLTATSLPVRTSPVVRGKWLLETMLGEDLPPPPANAGDLPEPKGELAKMTLRQRFELHRSAPQCASCHNRIDPLGYGLENFDGVGRWRENDNGHPVDSVGVLPSGEKFRGPAELRSVLLARRDAFVRSMAARMLAFALGRDLRYHDDPVVDRIAADVAAAGYRPSALLAGIANSHPFQYKRVDSNQEPSE